MFKRFVVTLAAFGLVVAACGGDADSCQGVADDVIDLVQDVIDEVDDMTPEDVAALGETEPEFMVDFDEEAEKLADQAASLGCSDEELSGLIKASGTTLSADSELGKFFVELVNSGEFLGL